MKLELNNKKEQKIKKFNSPRELYDFIEKAQGNDLIIAIHGDDLRLVRAEDDRVCFYWEKDDEGVCYHLNDIELPCSWRSNFLEYKIHVLTDEEFINMLK